MIVCRIGLWYTLILIAWGIETNKYVHPHIYIYIYIYVWAVEKNTLDYTERETCTYIYIHISSSKLEMWYNVLKKRSQRCTTHSTIWDDKCAKHIIQNLIQEQHNIPFCGVAGSRRSGSETPRHPNGPVCRAPLAEGALQPLIRSATAGRHEPCAWALSVRKQWAGASHAHKHCQW